VDHAEVESVLAWRIRDLLIWKDLLRHLSAREFWHFFTNGIGLDPHSPRHWRLTDEDFESLEQNVGPIISCAHTAELFSRGLESTVAKNPCGILSMFSSTWRLCWPKRGRPSKVLRVPKVGDHICILAGMPIPFILRPLPGTGSRAFLLVGPCFYLPGVMNEEAIEEAVWLRGGGCTAQYVFEDIEIH
jgi:hypothetical protein